MGILIVHVLDLIKILCGRFFRFDGNKYRVCQYVSNSINFTQRVGSPKKSEHFSNQR